MWFLPDLNFGCHDDPRDTGEYLPGVDHEWQVPSHGRAPVV